MLITEARKLNYFWNNIEKACALDHLFTESDIPATERDYIWTLTK